MKRRIFACLIAAFSLSVIPLGMSSRGPVVETAAAGWKTKLAMGTLGGAALGEYNAVRAATFGVVAAMRTPLYRNLVIELARLVWEHPIVGPPAAHNAIETAKREGDLSVTEAEKLEADIMAAHETARGTRQAGFGDRQVPNFGTPGITAGPSPMPLPGRDVNDGALGVLPGSRPNDYKATVTPGYDAHVGGPIAHAMPLPQFVLDKIGPGLDFNRREERHHRFNEIAVGLYPPHRLDSYVPGKEIISRKFTQLAELKPATAIGYIRELPTKYAPGTPILNSERNIAYGLAPGVLEGQMYLDVPTQTEPIPEYILQYAARHEVIIRQRPYR